MTKEPTPIISVRNISKTYWIGGPRERYKRISESISDTFFHPVKWLSSRTSTQEVFYALRDVSFDVFPGEVVGIIGRNGAGKSTLLKILSGITYPTSGEIELNGRVGSLLEVGTGFHSELTGRENIYFNGSILGMTRREIENKFDEIIRFAGIEEFLDTPVKRYSSGMAVRLGFAVAAHLDPEILVVDEVLAVGDAEFQKKCLRKMKEVSEGGRTVLFVSHNMGAIERLCEKVLLIDRGALKNYGQSQIIIREYLSSGEESKNLIIWDIIDKAPGDEFIRIHKISVKTEEGNVKKIFDIRESITIEIEFWNLVESTKKACGIHLFNNDGLCLFSIWDINSPNWSKRILNKGLIISKCVIPGNLLAEDRFTVSVGINSFFTPPLCHVGLEHIISFEVIDPGEGDSVRGELQTIWTGVMRPMLVWETKILKELSDL